jgi:hypothetical protein
LHIGERDVREIAASDARKKSPRIHNAHAIREHGQLVGPVLFAPSGRSPAPPLPEQIPLPGARPSRGSGYRMLAQPAVGESGTNHTHDVLNR